MISYEKLVNKLKDAGWTQSKLKKEKILGSAIITKLFESKEIERDGEISKIKGFNGNGIDMRIIDRLCKLLNCQPGDVLDCVPDPEWYSDQAKVWKPDKNFYQKTKKENEGEKP